MSLGTTSAIITEGGCPVEVTVNINCGAYSETFLYDSIYVQSNDTNVYVPVGVVVSNVYKKAQFVNVTNGNFWMTQSNISNIGHQRWGFCLDTLGTTGNTGTLVNPLFDGSIILGQQASAPRVGRYIFDEQNMLALADFKVVNLTANPTNLNAIMVKKRFAPMNPVPPEWGNWWCWGAEEYDVIFKPGTSANSLERWLMVQYVKVFKYDPPLWWKGTYPCPGTVPDLYVGQAIDFDVKSDSGSDNYPGFDASMNLVYQQGYGGGNNLNQYAGLALHDPLKKPADQPAAYGGHVLRNDVYVYPMNGYRDDSLYSVMSKPGFAILDTSTTGKPEDFDCVLTAGKILSHTPNLDTTQYRFVVAFSNKGLDTLKYMVNMVRCGNADRGVDGMVNLGDVIKLANMILKQQEEIWRYMSDVNGDCATNLSDCIYLANNVFAKPGFPLKCNCEQFWP
jgi:hypothetical protein